MKNIFVVSSPLQLINALEAKSLYGTINDEFIIFESPNKRNNTYVKYILDLFKVPTASVINYNDSQIRLLWDKLKLVKSLLDKSYQRMFIGDYGEYSMRLFAFKIEYQELYVLDDGAATLKWVNDDRLRKRKLCWKNFYSSKNLIREILTISMLPINNNSRKINWFSMFDIESKVDKYGEKVIKNNLTYLKNFVHGRDNSVLDDKVVYFLGSGVAEIGAVSKSDYIDLVSKIKDYYTSYRFVYLPHRAEDEGKLGYLKTHLNIEILYLDTVVELGFFAKNIFPQSIASISFSTALFTLKKIYPRSDIKSFNSRNILENNKVASEVNLLFSKEFEQVIL